MVGGGGGVGGGVILVPNDVEFPLVFKRCITKIIGGGGCI